ncbi:LysR family transcriptional regulator [Pseudopedobacter beijingensis]|uniref:LysR family transcriptional regulator n=1 Tax=Pseudopedobacter beijingensis TaxID=1207056 RepID=A0ABW4IDS5_9SPHI
MELRHLLYFKTVAEELHFRKAASKLFVSQPPLSRQIKELEEELGVVLFDRNNKKVKLTDAGIYFKKQVDELFESLSESKNIVRQIHDSISGELRIGYISSTFHDHLIEVLKEMSTFFPYVKTKLYEIPSIKQLAALEAGKLDLGIIRGPVYSEKLEVRHLFTDPFVLVGSDLLSEKDPLALKQYLQNKPFVFFNQDYAPHFYDKLLEICSRIGFVPEVVHEANNVHSILQLVEKGMGVSILPVSSIVPHKHLKLCFTLLDMDFITTEVVIVTNGAAEHTAVKWFVDKYAERFS